MLKAKMIIICLHPSKVLEVHVLDMSISQIKTYFNSKEEIIQDFVTCLHRQIGCVGFDVLLSNGQG